MKVLLIGDIVGNIGVKKVKEVLPKIKKEKNEIEKREQV